MAYVSRVARWTTARAKVSAALRAFVKRSGRLDGGDSKVRCEMGSVKIHLEKGSSVRVTARSTMGKVTCEGEATDKVSLGQTGKDVTFGSGDGSLDVECTMGNVRISAE